LRGKVLAEELPAEARVPCDIKHHLR
jgi:hypothetical protein